MLAKVNELNKNVVILLSVGIIAITSIIITLIATSEGSSKGAADSLVSFQKYIEDEYGVKPEITVQINDVSESKAKTFTENLRKKLGTGEILPVDFESKTWYSTQSKDEKLMINAFYEK